MLKLSMESYSSVICNQRVRKLNYNYAIVIIIWSITNIKKKKIRTRIKTPKQFTQFIKLLESFSILRVFTWRLYFKILTKISLKF